MKNTVHKLLPPPHWAAVLFAAVFLISLTIFCHIAGYPLVIPALVLLTGFHLFFQKSAHWKRCLYVGLLLALMIVGVDVMIRQGHLSPLYVPVASLVMLTVFLFHDLHLGFALSFVASVIATMIAGGDLWLMILYFMGSLSGAYAIWGARTRGQFLKAGVVIALVYIACLAMKNPSLSEISSRTFLIQKALPLAINAFMSSFLVMVTLRIFERLFGVVTNYTLLELADFNQPLLKRMMMEAPGTYQHSLAVSQLAEAAADTIGANGLLCRVGGYYHDIGKLVTPEYFTENQKVGPSKHDAIEPTMSRLVILNHVKEGMELGKKYRLNPMILNFIPEHHGTALIHYFYHKSVEGAEVGETVEEQDFRYPGPKPQSRETAIVMLADSVEGAVRAMEEHTPARMEDVVRKVINNKFIDGQLDECPLTLKDIYKISQEFTRLLSAMYHGRVKYPD